MANSPGLWDWWLHELCIIPADQRPSMFTLSIGNSSDVNVHTQCASHNGAVAAGATLNESCTATGRYISFTVKNEAYNPLTTLCEVVVIGHRYVCTYPLFILLLSVNSSRADTNTFASNAFIGTPSDQLYTY